MNFKAIDKCDNKETWKLKFLILLSRLNSSDSKINEAISICGRLLGNQFKAMLSFGSKKIKSKTDLEKHLKYFHYDKEEIKKIVSFYEKKQAIRKQQRDLLRYFYKTVELLEDKKQLTNLHKYSQEVLSKLDSVEKTFLSSMIEILVALANNNISWVKRIIQETLQTDFASNIFEIQRYHFQSVSEYNSFKDSLLKVFRVIRSKIDDNLLFNLFMIYLDYGLEGNTTSVLQDELTEKWSLVDIRKIIKSNSYGRNYFKVWAQILRTRTSEQEVLNFFESSLTVDIIKEKGKKLLSTYLYYLPKDKKNLKTVFEVMRKEVLLLNDYERFIFLKLTSRGVIKDSLGPFLPELRLANFQLERTFYREMLKKGKAIEFSIYHLIKLGDLSDDLLWWLIL